MKVEAARTKFVERLYNWALEEWKREISNNFPLLRDIEKKEFFSIHETLEVMKTLEKDQQWIMARALVRRFWASQSGLFNERDKQLVKLYLDKGQAIHEEDALKIPLETEWKKPNRAKLKKYVVANLRSILGEKREDYSNRYELAYINPIGPFQIMTHVDMTGTFFGYYQIRYHHAIMVSGQTPQVPLSEPLSLVSWLGISGGSTNFKLITDEDAEPVVKSLAKIVKHFLDAAPKLLEGLTLD